MCVSETECLGLHKSGGRGVGACKTHLLECTEASSSDLWTRRATFTYLTVSRQSSRTFCRLAWVHVSTHLSFTPWQGKEITAQLYRPDLKLGSVHFPIFTPIVEFHWLKNDLCLSALWWSCSCNFNAYNILHFQIHPDCQSICLSFHPTLCLQIGM